MSCISSFPFIFCLFSLFPCSSSVFYFCLLLCLLFVLFTSLFFFFSFFYLPLFLLFFSFFLSSFLFYFSLSSYFFVCSHFLFLPFCFISPNPLLLSSVFLPLSFFLSVLFLPICLLFVCSPFLFLTFCFISPNPLLLSFITLLLSLYCSSPSCPPFCCSLHALPVTFLVRRFVIYCKQLDMNIYFINTKNLAGVLNKIPYMQNTLADCRQNAERLMTRARGGGHSTPKYLQWTVMT